MFSTKSIPWFSAYIITFVVLLLAAMPNGLHTEISLKAGSDGCTPYLQEVLFSCRSDHALTPLSTIDDVISVYKLNDHASYAKAAKSGYLSVASTWPPGLIVIEGFFYSISPNFPVGLGLAVLACFMWAGTLMTIWALCYRRTSSFLLSFIPGFLLTICIDMSTYLGSGLFVAETYAVAAFLFGIGMLTNLPNKGGHCFSSLVAGGAFAVAAYFRAQYDQIMMIASGLTVLLFAAILFGRRFRVPGAFSKDLLLVTKALLLTVCAYHVVTLPYRATHYWGWIDTSNSVIWRLTWEKPTWFTGEKSFFLKGGGAAGCTLDASICSEIWDRLPAKEPGTLVADAYQAPPKFSNSELQNRTISSFAHHPIAWLSFKGPYILRGFVDTGMAVPMAVFAVVILGLSISRRSGPLLTLGFFLIVLVVSVVGPLLLIHLEPRYLDPLVTFICFAAICTISLHIGNFSASRAGIPKSSSQ